MDNTTRYKDILWAQDMKMAAERLGYNAEELFRLSSTKFNIKIMQPRDGIKLKCLPKDAELLAKAFDSPLINNMIERNEVYKQYATDKGLPKTPDL